MAKRFLMWLFITFIGTLLLCTFVGIEAAICLAGLCLIALLPSSLFRYRYRITTVGCLIFAVLAVGLYVWSFLPASRLEQQLLGQECKITGTVVEVDQNSAKTLDRITVRLTAVGDKKISMLRPFCLYIYTDPNGVWPIGDKISGSVSFFDHGVDFKAGRQDSVFVSGYQEGAQLIVTPSYKQNGYRILDGFKQKIQSRIAFGSEKTKGFLRSVCFGNKTDLDPALAVSLRRCGLSHVTAVSGLHLTFTVALFGFLFLVCGVSYKIRHLLGIFVAILFTAFVGFPPSCVRACVMLVIFSLGMALGLFSDSLTSLSLAAFLIVLAEPFAIRDLGYLMSVSATAGLILLSRPTQSFLFPAKLKIHRRWLTQIYRWFTGTVSCSVAATIATLPIAVFVFGAVSLIAPLANVVLLYPVQLFFMCGILMSILGFIPGVGIVLGVVCDFLYQLIDGVASKLGHLSFASVSAISWSGWLFMLLFVGMLGVAIYHFTRFKQRSFWAFFAMFLLFCGSFGLIKQATHPKDSLEIAFVDVGQGDCTALVKDGRAVLFDYGGSSQKRYELMKYLRKQGVFEVELLAFTHLHNDHTNGLHTLLDQVYVEQILYPDLPFDSTDLMALIGEQNGRILDSSESITVLDDVTVVPIVDAVYNKNLATDNERCVCYYIQYGSTSLLITGDMEGRTEMALLPQMADCTLLKVAHHGSDSSSIYPFLKTVSPEIAVISVGENSYNLPDSSVVERLKTLCTAVYITKTDGTVRFQSDGAVLERILS